MNLTLELVRDTFCSCYEPERLASLYDRPHTPLEVATRTDGPWATVPASDRIWTLTRPGVLPERTLRLFACWCDTTALDAEEAAGRTVDPRSREAVRVATLHADGHVTDSELAAARAAAESAAWAAARAAFDSQSLAHLITLIKENS